MENTTTPQEVDSTAADTSLDDRIAAKFGFADEPQEEAPEPAAETATPDDGELSPDELQPDDSPEPLTAEEWLELDRKGEKRKVSKEEARRLAQQGWDYSENQRSLKEEREHFEQVRAAVTAKAQLHPRLIEAAADVKAYERALQQYEGVDLVKIATDDPLGYPAVAAQLQQLRDGYQQAVHNYRQVEGAAQQVESAINDNEVQAQFRVLFERAPELKDETRLKAEQGKVLSYLREVGARPHELRIVATSAEAFLLARDGLRYRQAMKARAERGQQIQKAPPVLKPGTAPERTNAKAAYADKVKALHQAKDPDRKKALLDEVIARKFGIG